MSSAATNRAVADMGWRDFSRFLLMAVVGVLVLSLALGFGFVLLLWVVAKS